MADRVEFQGLDNQLSYWSDEFKFSSVEPRSPEYEAFYDAKTEEQQQKRGEVIDRLNKLYQEFDVVDRETDENKKNKLFSRLLLGAFTATAYWWGNEAHQERIREPHDQYLQGACRFQRAGGYGSVVPGSRV